MPATIQPTLWHITISPYSEKVRWALDQISSGGAFSVADLTATALLYPLVRPPEADVTIDRMPEPVERLRAELRERRGYRWVEETFRRHRRPAEASPT